MPQRAKVHSLEAVENFRASLIVYLEKTRGTLDDISDDVTRTRMWLQDEQRVHWENEVRKRERDLERRQGELFSARLSFMDRGGQAEAVAVHKAKRALEDANEHLATVKKWTKQFDNRVLPLAKDVDKLRDVLVQHMRRAVTHLTQVTKALADYAQPAEKQGGGS